jgi:hypothetical protein
MVDVVIKLNKHKITSVYLFVFFFNLLSKQLQINISEFSNLNTSTKQKEVTQPTQTAIKRTL